MTNYSLGINNNYAAVPSFKAQGAQSQAQAPQTNPMQPDKAAFSNEVKPEQKSEKKGVVRGFKNLVGGIKKFFVNVGEYAKGTAKGLFYGAIGAAGVLGVDALRNGFKEIKRIKAGKVAAEGNKFKYLSGKGKVAAGVVALAVMGYQLFKASLNASEKRSDVDHRWGTPHNKV